MGPLPRTMSVPDAGDWLGVGSTTARWLARIYRETGGAYGIPNIRVGQKLRVPGVLLAEYFAEDRITPPDFADELAPRRRRDPAAGDSDAVGSGGSVSSTRRLTVRRGSQSSGGRGRGGPAPAVPGGLRVPACHLSSLSPDRVEPTRWERAALTREASAHTRSAKSANGSIDLRTRWIDEATEHGWTPRGVVDAVETVGHERANESVPTLTVSGVIEALSTSGSTWSRPDVLRAVCDAQRPLAQLDGRQWAAALEQLCDQVIDRCVELDPEDADRRRKSDGRSMWLEPIAPHLTSEAVLAEEERVLTWAMDADAAEPSPSLSVDTSDLDVLQANAAAAVAGHDRLVLIVGPAGAGKTSALSAAVADLQAQRRPVFGVAPSAKAARVLQRDAGLRADTVAKLLHEWERGDRPPLRDYVLPAGTTVIVDEAGMIGTSALARLVALAEQRHWRIALVGDPCQLQAVGRGGLFHELCATGPSYELQRIHRFEQKWEAAASLQLRNGDSRALKTYEAHGRIVPDTFESHVERLAAAWLDAAARGDSCAITTSTNDHVDAMNAAVQAARIRDGQLNPVESVRIGGDEHAHAGDIVATRRNDRQLTTDDGEPVRNRELWTVTAVHADGSLTARRNTGRGTVTLPADYVAEHVRLGYAATEQGNQSDTVTVGIQLVTAATTRRGL